MTRSFGPTAINDMTDSIVALGWPRDEVAPLVIDFLGRLESVMICFNIEAAQDWIVRHLLAEG